METTRIAGALNEREIEALEAADFRRWTKGDYDRLYYKLDDDHLEQLGLYVERYRTGNISYAEWHGKRISNSQAREMAPSSSYRIWVDVATGEVHDQGAYYGTGRWCDEIDDLVQHIRESVQAA